ncbi:C25 family cysteine peptidase [Candidatus Leptofilum sp.]|uniref:C25 family cysteine peptidase n=1 Tax=Candidatus Leptofilum sp. TaxID=3241576 RepID=UPI003B595032
MTAIITQQSRPLLLLLLGVGWLVLGGEQTYSALPTSASPAPQITLLADGLHLTWNLPQVEELPQPDGSVSLTIPGFEMEALPGYPVLPQSSVLVALPPDAEPELAFVETAVNHKSLSHSLTINPQPQGVQRDAAEQLVGGAMVPAPPQQDALPILQLTEIGTMRGVRLARLTLRPVQPDGDQLRLTAAITATIQFNSVSNASRPTETTFNPLQTAVASQVINPDQLITEQPYSQPATVAATDPAVFIEVAAPGITAITHSDLQAAGFAVNEIDPANLQLWYDGQERPLEWFGDGDAQFEPDESFRFYAAPWFSRWQTNDMYKLTVGSSPGTRMGSQPASPSGLTTGSLWLTVVAEQNNLYTPDCLCGYLPAGRDGDRWVWEDLRQPGRPSASYNIELPYVNQSQAAQLTLWAIGFTSLDASPDHHLNLSFNDSGVGSVSWDGKTAVTNTLSLPASSLQASSTLNLSIPAVPGVSIDGLWLDAFAVRYSYNGSQIAANEQLFVEGASARRAYTVNLGSSAGLRLYDVTDPAAPAVLNSTSLQGSEISWGDPDAAGHNYLISNSSSLHTPAAIRLPQTLPVGSADMIIISHASFVPALTPLVNLRQSQGLSVLTADVQAVYDGFGNGRITPEAIRSYLSDLYHSGSPAPTYVLLVGDGTSDPKQYRTDSQATWLPPYLADTDPWIGEVAADNRFVTVDGDDFLPDMIIGRLPVNSLAEAQTVVSKIVEYETEPFFGDWNGRITFIADNTDAAGNFAAHSANLQQSYVSDPWQPTNISYNPATNTETAVQTQIQQAWQNGQGLMVYTGHSSIHQWGAERFFHLDDVENLQNGGRLPVLLQMTCFTGSFTQPFWDTLDESLLRQPDGGVVAVWGATGLGVGTGHDALAGGFLQAVIGADEVRVGTAVLAGKLNLLTDKPAHQDLLDTFTLFGDPATQYNTDFWAGIPTYLPLISR